MGSAAWDAVLSILLGQLPFSFVNTQYLVLSQVKSVVPERDEIASLFSMFYALAHVITMPYNLFMNYVIRRKSALLERRVHWCVLLVLGLTATFMQVIFPEFWSHTITIAGSERSVFLLAVAFIAGLVGSGGNMALFAFIAPFSQSCISACSSGLCFLGIVPAFVSVILASAADQFWASAGIRCLTYTGAAATLIGVISTVIAGWYGPAPIWGSHIASVSSLRIISEEDDQNQKSDLEGDSDAPTRTPHTPWRVRVRLAMKDCVYPINVFFTALIIYFVVPPLAALVTSNCGHTSSKEAEIMNDWAVLLYQTLGCLSRALAKLLKMSDVILCSELNVLAAVNCLLLILAPLGLWGTHPLVQLQFAFAGISNGLVTTGVYLLPTEYTPEDKQRIFNNTTFFQQTGNLLASFVAKFLISAIKTACPA